MRSFLLIFIFVGVLIVSGCDDSYDFDKYRSYKNNGEMEDAVKEWVRETMSDRSFKEWITDYVEDHCQVSDNRREIECY